MKALGFLLVRTEADDWQVLDSGNPGTIRQEFKELLGSKNEYKELFYADHLGRVKRKFYRKKETGAVKESLTPEPEPEPEETYRGPARKQSRKTKA